MAQRATSLGPKPSKFIYFLFFLVCCCSFPFFALSYTEKNLVFPPKKGIFVYFLCFSFFLPLPFFGLPLFSIFLSLSLSASCPFFLSFLSFFFAFFCFLVFVSFFPFLSSLLLFQEKNNIRKIDVQSSSSSIFFFLGFLSSFLFEIPFSSLCFFADLKLCFCSTSLFWVSKNQVEKHQFLVKRGVATKRFFFMNLCFAKCKKLSFFWGAIFWANFGGCAKNTIKIGISALFKKAKNGKKGHFQSQ